MGPHLAQCGLDQGADLHAKCHRDPSSRLVTIDKGRKLGRGSAPFWTGELGPHLTQYCVRWGPSSLSKKGRSPPILGPRLLWPNGCMDQNATWYGGRPRSTWLS